MNNQSIPALPHLQPPQRYTCAGRGAPTQHGTFNRRPSESITVFGFSATAGPRELRCGDGGPRDLGDGAAAEDTGDNSNNIDDVPNSEPEPGDGRGVGAIVATATPTDRSLFVDARRCGTVVTGRAPSGD